MIFVPIRPEFRCQLFGWTRGIALPFLCFLLLISFVHGSPQVKSVCGEPFAREALPRVRTYCVDTSHLREGEASDVKTFVERENRPGQLLRRLIWELTDQCAAADAVIRVYFAETGHVVHIQRADAPLTELNRAGQGTVYEQQIQAVLLIYDRASVRILYRTEGRYVGQKRKTMLKGLFSSLAKDLKGAQSLTVPPSPLSR